MDTPAVMPIRVARLPRDHRGLPIPFIVLRDLEGKPHFTVNDARKQHECVVKSLCGICGQRLFKGNLWFVGGPLSAFNKKGAYIDGPMHPECAFYALQTCPFLAAPKYMNRLDDRTLKPELGHVTLVDPTMLPGRPKLFVAMRCEKARHDGQYFHPYRPAKTFQFWVKGQKIELEEGIKMAMDAFEEHGIPLSDFEV